MKKTATLIIVLMLCCMGLHAQNSGGMTPPEAPPPTRTITEENSIFPTKGMSPSTALLLVDLMRMQKNPAIMSQQQIMDKYSLLNKGGTLYANSFIVATPGFSMAAMEEAGVLQGHKSGNIYTALVPVYQLADVAKSTGVKYLAIGEKLSPLMDSARIQTNVNQVHQGLAPLTMPYTGKGVVVGVIDKGFDYTHPNFYDSTGTNNYRIKRVWQQLDNTGTPPAGYNYGRELTTQTAMLNAGTDDSLDNHGSHVAGIAAGAGGYTGSPYKGVAYESDIVVIATDYSTTKVAEGIQYIQDYAKSVNKPCVINMSFGGQIGPHDGTSLFDQYMDSLNKPGNILVSSAGNDGRNPLYLEHKFALTDTVIRTVCAFNNAGNSNAGSGIIDMWGEPNQNFSVRLLLLNSTNFTFENGMAYKAPAAINMVDTIDLTGSNNAVATGIIYTGIDPINNKPRAFIRVFNFQPDGARKIVVEITAFNTTTKMWGLHQGNPFFTNAGFLGNFKSGSTNNTMSESGACGNSVITVGAYTSKNQWTSQNNQHQVATYPAQVGDISPSSSKGPTADGRTKPDITAPGNVLASSVNSFNALFNANSRATAKAIEIGNKTWYMGLMQGTSMAAPMVTGIIALWMQKYPNLTRDQAIALMKGSAITDTFTGKIPTIGSNTWGWGKINALGGLISVAVENVPEHVATNIYPNPATNEVNIAFKQAVGTSVVVLYDITGKVVYHKQLSQVSAGHIEKINTDGLTSGVYALKISNDQQAASYKIIKQ
jgi:minor extracellular serine protease Vpr